MTPVYVMLAIAMLLLVLYATWRPLREGKHRRANKMRAKVIPTQGNTETRVRTEMPPLDYTTTDVNYRR
jgi:hypothetical protein